MSQLTDRKKCPSIVASADGVVVVAGVAGAVGIAAVLAAVVAVTGTKTCSCVYLCLSLVFGGDDGGGHGGVVNFSVL